MSEWRRNPRVKEVIPVHWKMVHQEIHGEGAIRNVSISGLMVEVDDHFKPTDSGLFMLDVVSPDMVHLIPHQVKLIWYSRIMADKMRQFCGMKFVDTTGPVFARLVEHVEEQLAVFHGAMDINIIQNYLFQSN